MPFPSTPGVQSANSTAPLAPNHALRHSRYEDFQALFTGTLFVSITLMLFAQAGLMTGGTAGIALLVHYWSGLPLGTVFFALNLPFYWLAWKRMGPEFTIKTFIAVGLLSLLTDIGPQFLHVNYLNPLFAAVLGGLLLGTGCLFLARHRASLGGATILALYLQERYGIAAGKVQLLVDCSVVALALFMVPVHNVLYSILAAVVMGVFLWISHRPGRYISQ